MSVVTVALLALLPCGVAQVFSTQTGSTWLANGQSQYLSAAGSTPMTLSFKYIVQGHVEFYTSFAGGYANGQTYCNPGVVPTVGLVSSNYQTGVACPMDATDSSATCLNIVSNWSPTCLLAFCRSAEGCNLALSASWKNTYYAVSSEVPVPIFPVSPSPSGTVSPTVTPSTSTTLTVSPTPTVTMTMTPSTSSTLTATPTLTPTTSGYPYTLAITLFFTDVKISLDTPVSPDYINSVIARAISTALAVSPFAVKITFDTFPDPALRVLGEARSRALADLPTSFYVNATIGVTSVSFISSLKARIVDPSFTSLIDTALSLDVQTSTEFFSATVTVASIQGVAVLPSPAPSSVAPPPLTAPLSPSSSPAAAGGAGSGLSLGAIIGIAASAFAAVISALGGIWLQHIKNKHERKEKAEAEKRNREREEKVERERAELHTVLTTAVSSTLQTKTVTRMTRSSVFPDKGSQLGSVKQGEDLQIRMPPASVSNLEKAWPTPPVDLTDTPVGTCGTSFIQVLNTDAPTPSAPSAVIRTSTISAPSAPAFSSPYAAQYNAATPNASGDPN